LYYLAKTNKEQEIAFKCMETDYDEIL